MSERRISATSAWGYAIDVLVMIGEERFDLTISQAKEIFEKICLDSTFPEEKYNVTIDGKIFIFTHEEADRLSTDLALSMIVSKELHQICKDHDEEVERLGLEPQ